MVEKNRLMLMVESISKFSTGVLVDLTSKVAMKVLHVDDDLDCLKVAEQCLEMQGRFRVDTVRSAEEAMEKMKKETYDVIISDYQMPGKNGLEFLKELREKGNNTPFIIFTGKDRKEVAIKALNFGADGYFNKHGDPETVYGELAHGIRQAIERKKAEMKIWEREERLRAVFGSSPDAITVSDLHGNILDCNEAAWKMLGFSSKEEVIGKSSFDFIAKKDRQKALENLKKTLEQGTTRNVEYALLNKDGDELWGELSASIIRDSVGNPVCFVGVIRDTSERKKAEASLRESEEKNRKTIENANVGIITYDSEGEVKVLNPKMEEMTGFKRKEIPTLVNWFEKLYPNEEERRKVRDKWFKRMSGEGEVKEGHAIITTKEGKRRNFLFNGVQLESGDSIAFAHDITERKKAEEERRETKDYLDNLLNYANAPIIVWDNENKISLFNNAFEVLTGYKKESVLGRNIDVLFPPLQKEEILQTIEKATKGEKWQSVEVPILCKGKETRIALWNSANITDKDGNIVATIAQGQDITERKKVEKTLQESEERFRAIFEGANDGILVADTKTKRFAFANPRICEITGYSLEELLKLGIGNIHPKKDLPYVIDSFTKQMQGKLTLSKDIPVLRKDERVVYCDVNSKPIKIGSHEYLVGLFRDVTEHKKAEEALQDAKEKWASLTENTDDLVMIVDGNGVIRYINITIPPYTPEETVGKTVYEYVPREQHNVFEKSLREVFKTGKPGSYQVSSNIPKIGTIWFSTKVVPIKHDGKISSAILISSNITDRKKAEEELRNSEERLKETNKKLEVANEKLHVVGNLTRHDVRNKLTAVTGNIYLLRQRLGENPEELEKLKGIEAAVQQAVRILEFAEIYEKLGVEQPTYLDAKKILDEAASLFSDLKGVRIVNDCAGLTVLADSLLRQVFYNMIDNSLKYGETIKQIRVYYKMSSGDKLELVYEDDGVGIPSDMRDTLFKEGVGKGTGYGLFMIKRIIAVYGWNIQETGIQGKGVKFVITIPKTNPKEKENYRTV